LYEELLEGRFRLSKVVRIDHKDDGNDVANKIFDYSSKTIEKLMEHGYRDTLVQMGVQSMKHTLIELAKISGSSSHFEKGNEDINNNKIQELERRLNDIQESIKIENGYDTTLNEVDKFIAQVESIVEPNTSRLLLKEEKSH